MEIDDIYSQTNAGKDIFDHYMGEEIETNKRYNSVFRDEKNPSMAFYTSRNDGWRVKDFGMGNNVGPIEFVQLYFKIDFVEAKKKIIADLRLTTPQYKKKFADKPIRPVIKEDIKVKVDKFEICCEKLSHWMEEDVAYWDKYKIHTDKLEEYNIFPIRSYTIVYADTTKVPVKIHRSKDNPLIYVFELKDVDGKERKKIYCPLISNKDYKWVGNTTAETIQGAAQLKKNVDTLIIASSMKDGLALYTMFAEFGFNQNFEFVAGNSESVLVPGDILTSLRAHYKNVFSLLDWDDAGKRFSKIYEAKHRIQPMNHLLRDLNIKDSAEVAEYCDYEEIYKFVKSVHDFIEQA